MKETRRAVREVSSGGVTYIATSNNVAKLHTGLLSNLSNSGACIYTHECIQDKRVKLYFNEVSADPMTADVMWCEESIDNLYKVGLKFHN